MSPDVSIRRKATSALGAARLDSGLFDATAYPNLLGYWDARYVNGLGGAQPAANAAIASWTDLSGNGRTLAQGTGGQQPLFRAAGYGGVTSPRIDFDGVNDVLYTGNLTSARCSPISVYIVTKPDSTTTGGICEYTNTIGGAHWWHVRANSGWALDASGPNGQCYYDAVAGWSGVSQCVISAVTNTAKTGWRMRRNGIDVSMAMNAASVDIGTGTSALPFHVGGRGTTGSDPFDGSVTALIVYSGQHSLATASEIESRIKTTFGIG